jgi:hypothetical protein
MNSAARSSRSAEAGERTVVALTVSPSTDRERLDHHIS